MLRVSTIWFEPSSALTSTCPGAVMRAAPKCTSILFLRRRKSTPFTLPSTPSALKAIIFARSSFGALTPIPISAKWLRASSKRSEACSKAFDGMQPTFRQVPPCVLRFSTTATFSPSCAARMAQTYPPGPVPMTTRS
jgi:hypothetical protein